MKIALSTGRRRLAALAMLAIVIAAGIAAVMLTFGRQDKLTDALSQSKPKNARYVLSASERGALSIEPVTERIFRAEHATEGKIAIDEDLSTPVFSPYAGRVVKLLVKPSDMVQRGQPMFVIEATDTVQGLNDFVGSLGAQSTATSKLHLAEIVEKRANDLYAGKAVPLKDWQQAQADLISAQNDMRSADTTLEAARNRLRILGRTEEQIATFQQTRQISADTPIYAPIAGTIVQRKIGPGQFIASGASDPVFVIGDLSKVWLTAFVRESEVADVAVGQDVSFVVLALPGHEFKTQLDFVSASIDPSTRRLLARATIDNKDGLLKPEMFANVTIFAGSNRPSVAVPKQALIYEGERVKVWVAHDDQSIDLREISTGLVNGDLVEVKSNLRAGEKIVTRGSLFIDRAASSGS